MTQRDYYDDSYTVEFEARISAVASADGRTAIELDHTSFYPTSGGQPHDTGRVSLGDKSVAVLDVIDGPDKQTVIHLLASPVVGAAPGAEVHGFVDWPRRFDHMQHHTGQHLLSQSFIRLGEAETVGFHLSEQTVTIDLNRADLSEAEIAAAERMVNELIWENRPVRSRQVSLEEAQQLGLRKLPHGVGGLLRVVEIEAFDVTACGGTHLARTSEVGQLKITRVENRRDGVRVTFCCGGRALDEHGRKNALLGELTTLLTTGADEIPTAVSRLQQENKDARSTIKRQQAALLAGQAQVLLADAEEVGHDRLVATVLEELEADDLGQLGRLLVTEPHVIALLGTAGTRGSLLFSRSADAAGSMKALLAAALLKLEGGRGGGSDVLARGGSQNATRQQIEQAVAAARSLLRSDANRLE